MNVNLYYIHGISRIDTPYFATKTSQATLSKQEEFFSNHLVQSVQLSYYPPHYRNTIKFDSEDVTLNTNINYLSLEYNDKTYYYFIDSINYVSESIIELEISMDVIQTYMFDIEISNGIIERKFINRWYSSGGQYYINRNYIRENVSENEFVYTNMVAYNSNPRDWLVIISKIQIGNTKDSNTAISYSTSLPGLNVNNSLPSGNVYLITPFYPTKVLTKWYLEEDGANAGIYPRNVSSEDTNYQNIDVATTLSFYARNNVIVDAVICPFNFLEYLTLTPDGVYDYNIATFTNDAFFGLWHGTEIGSAVFPHFLLVASGFNPGAGDHYFMNYKIKCKEKYNSYTFGFSTNQSVGVAFTANYMPVLLDENYIRYTFGTNANKTTFPLFRLTQSILYNHYTFNPSDGTRLYWINQNTSGADDVYNTMVVDTNVLHLDLKNDPWQQYVAANRGRWLAAAANTAVSLFAKGAMAAVKNKFAAQDIKDVVSNPASYDRRYKTPTLKKKPSALVQARQRDIELNDTEFKVGAIGAGKGVISQGIQDMNVNAQPPTSKQMAVVSSIPAKEALIMSYEERVNDYQQCAQYYHRNGYLVNEYINSKSHIFGYVFSRYYFNILKMQLPNVHLHNVIEDEDTCQLIADRLTDGVRLWNVNNAGVVIGDFQYDNVELDYL